MLRWTLYNSDTGVTTVLKRDPKGWEDLQLSHNRSETYEGFFFDFSLELAFTCKGGGKEFIDAAYNSKGSEGNISVTLDYKCSPVEWQTLFRGKINFSSYKQEYRGKVLYTVVDIEQQGITQIIKNRENTDVDILATESIGGTALTPYTYAPYDINLHSKLIRVKGLWRIDEQLTEIPALSSVPPPQSAGVQGEYFVNIPNATSFFSNVYLSPAIPTITSDIQDSFELVSDAEAVGGSLFNACSDDLGLLIDTNLQSDFLGSGNYGVTINWNISGEYHDRIYEGSPITRDLGIVSSWMRLYLQIADTQYSSGLPPGVILVEIPFYTTNAAHYATVFSGSGSTTTTINRGDKFWLTWVFTYQTAAVPTVTKIQLEYIYNTFELDISIDSQTDASTAKGVAIHEAWSRVCEGITDQTLAFKSEFFGRTNSMGLSYPSNGYGSFTAITDGLRVRGFQQSDTGTIDDGYVKKGIITNLKDMFDSCDSIWGVGLGIEDLAGTEVVRVEEVDYFYQNTLLIRLNNVPNIQMSFAKDLCYSKIQVGYRKWNIQEYNGIDEINTIARWVATKIKSVDNQLDLISVYVAGMYALEVTRRKNIQLGYATEDTEYDDDIFIIALKRDVDELDTCEKNENITVSDGLIDPASAYNLRFNLFSNFDRIMNQFTPGLTKDTPHDINYSYLEGNGSMLFQFNDGFPGDLNGAQSSNVQNTTYPNSRHRRGDPVLLPEIYTFSYPVSFSQYLNILNNPYGYVEFSETNVNHKKGYIKTLDYNLKKKIANFTLIRKWQ